MPIARPWSAHGITAAAVVERLRKPFARRSGRLVWISHAARNDLVLRHTRWLSNLVGVATVVAVGVAIFGLSPSLGDDVRLR